MEGYNEQAIISVIDVSKQYPKPGTVLNNLSFEIFKGKITGIIGPNGSGKTTLLAILTNLTNQTSGKLRINGNKEISIGAVVHSPEFFPFLTAYENLKYICDLRGIANSDSRIVAILSKVGLKNNGTSYKNFSYGMSQRLGIASALIADPDIIILDEPTNGIDPIDIEDIKSLIKNAVNEHNGLLISSHQVDEMIELCDYLLCLKDGDKIFFSEVEDLKVEALNMGLDLKTFLIQKMKKGINDE